MNSDKPVCHWPFSSLVVLSDLTAVCSSDDPYKRTVLGDLGTQSVQEIWNGPFMQQLRESLRDGFPAFCEGCAIRAVPTEDESHNQHAAIEGGPRILQIEPTILCNLRCPLCPLYHNPDGHLLERRSDFMSLSDFQRILDEAGSNLEMIRFYNYGESFLNSECYDMISYARKQRPRLFLEVHTNGLLFNSEQRRRRFVQSGLDYASFSIDGALAENYAKYRRRGKLEAVLENLREIVRLRDELRQPLYICWRYIIFEWNDSDEEMDLALSLARDIGVDQFVWHLNAHEQHASPRFQPGTAGFEKIRHALWDYGGIRLANALTRPTMLNIPRFPRVTAHSISLPFDRITAAPGACIDFEVVAKNRGNTVWRVGREDLRGTVRLGYHIFQGIGRTTDPLAEQRGEPFNCDVNPGRFVKTKVRVYAPEVPGLYRIQFDLVEEHVCWFRELGNEVANLQLAVE